MHAKFGGLYVYEDIYERLKLPAVEVEYCAQKKRMVEVVEMGRIKKYLASRQRNRRKRRNVWKGM